VHDVDCHQDIYNLYARYCEAMDGDDPHALALCFTDDGVWESRLAGRRTGSQEIAHLVQEMQSLDNRPFHQTTSIQILDIDTEAGTARGTARWLATYPRERPGRRDVAYGRYRDELRRDANGTWRFLFREVLHPSSVTTLTDG
jgi:ketosteroid isomerase-like protein